MFMCFWTILSLGAPVIITISSSSSSSSIFFELLLEFIFIRMSDHKMVIMASKYSTNNNIAT